MSKIGITGLHKGTASDLCTFAENSPILWQVTRSKGLRRLPIAGLVNIDPSDSERGSGNIFVGWLGFKKPVKVRP